MNILPLTTLIPFLGAAVVLAITPGPSIAYVVARTASGGRSEGLASCLGTAVGGTIHVLAAVFGLSLLLSQSAGAFTAVKYLGAAYLIYLGVRTLMSRQATPDPIVQSAPRTRTTGVRKAFVDGVFVEALNVKTALFFLAFIPQFVSPSAAPALQFVLLGGICVLLNTVVDIAVVFASQRLLRPNAARAGRARALTVASGCTMIGLGIYVGLTGRKG